MTKRPTIAIIAGAVAIVLNLLVLRPALHAADETACPSPRPACESHKECRENYSPCNVCFPNPTAGLHCTD